MKRRCIACGENKAALPLTRPRKDPRRHSQDENGKTWYAGYCPPCAKDLRYDAYRGWLERRAIRLGTAFPAEGKRR